MLPVGAIRQCYDDHPLGRWTNFTRVEQRTMLTLWCMLRSPLMIGGELTLCDGFTLDLLTNTAVLEIEKTSWCAHPLYTADEASAWIAPRTDGAGCYVAAFNLTDEPRRAEITADELGRGWARATELWTGAAAEGPSALLEPHGAAAWLLEY